MGRDGSWFPEEARSKAFLQCLSFLIGLGTGLVLGRHFDSAL